MKHKVIKKQENSNMCFVCGLKNSSGLKAEFYELANKELYATFTPKDQHQSYPGILHGGILSTILDETIGRAIMMKYDEPVWGVTIELNIKFKIPVPTDKQIRAISRITQERRNIFQGTGEILLPDGQVAVTGAGKFMKLPFDKISNLDTRELGWKIVSSPEDLIEVEL